jgi:hypothetical protein
MTVFQKKYAVAFGFDDFPLPKWFVTAPAGLKKIVRILGCTSGLVKTDEDVI